MSKVENELIKTKSEAINEVPYPTVNFAPTNKCNIHFHHNAHISFLRKVCRCMHKRQELLSQIS